MTTDIRWHQRLENYSKALQELSSAVQLAEQRPLSKLEKHGVIQGFEFTHELAWNVIKDYFFHQGQSNITGPRDATREAFNKQLIQEGDIWMEMIRSRNQTSHTYNAAIADEIVNKILYHYHTCFQNFLKKMQNLKLNDA
jgi:nucleotidyltransferase substrate binding protein (TIGR01987 family)